HLVIDDHQVDVLPLGASHRAGAECDDAHRPVDGMGQDVIDLGGGAVDGCRGDGQGFLLSDLRAGGTAALVGAKRLRTARHGPGRGPYPLWSRNSSSAARPAGTGWRHLRRRTPILARI